MIIRQNLNWSKKNKERIPEYMRKWRAKNKNYCNIISKTNRLFPVKEGTKCEFCDKQAKEHHHNTSPIEFDKFNYICIRCHYKKHNKEKRKLTTRWRINLQTRRRKKNERNTQ